MATRDEHTEMREPLRGSCRHYSDECFHRIDAERGYRDTVFRIRPTPAGWQW